LATTMSRIVFLALLGVTLSLRPDREYFQDSGREVEPCKFESTPESNSTFSFDLSTPELFEFSYRIPSGDKTFTFSACGNGLPKDITASNFTGRCEKGTSTACLCHPDQFDDVTQVCGSIADTATRKWFAIDNSSMGLRFTAPGCFANPSTKFNSVLLFTCASYRSVSEVHRDSNHLSQWCQSSDDYDFCSPCVELTDPSFCGPSFCRNDRACNGKGSCVRNRCECGPGATGVFCEQKVQEDEPEEEPVKSDTLEDRHGCGEGAVHRDGACVPCPENTRQDGDECEACPPGTGSAPGSSFCNSAGSPNPDIIPNIVFSCDQNRLVVKPAWLDLDMVCAGCTGQRLNVTCLTNAKHCPGSLLLGDHRGVIGSCHYLLRPNSSVCLAGIHSGAIPTTGGSFVINIEQLHDVYNASTRHGVTSDGLVVTEELRQITPPQLTDDDHRDDFIIPFVIQGVDHCE